MDKKVKQVMSSGWYQLEEEGNKEGEYGGSITYLCMKMEQWELLKLF
jgi:hypothetical protein